MNKVTEIVELILREIIETNDFNSFEKKIFVKLSSKGYEKKDIYAAFNYFNKRIISERLLNFNINSLFSYRILSMDEKLYLSEEAEKYLLSLIYLNKINFYLLEEILKYISLKNKKLIDIEELIDIIISFNLKDNNKEVSNILIN